MQIRLGIIVKDKGRERLDKYFGLWGHVTHRFKGGSEWQDGAMDDAPHGFLTVWNDKVWEATYSFNSVLADLKYNGFNAQITNKPQSARNGRRANFHGIVTSGQGFKELKQYFELLKATPDKRLPKDAYKWEDGKIYSAPYGILIVFGDGSWLANLRFSAVLSYIKHNGFKPKFAELLTLNPLDYAA